MRAALLALVLALAALLLLSRRAQASVNDGAAAVADAIGVVPDLDALGDVSVADTAAGASLLDSIGGYVSKLFTPPAAAAPYVDAIAAAEARNGIPQGLLLRQLDIESWHFSPAVIEGAQPSSAGAIGIAQFMPATAADFGLDPTDPYASIDAAGKYMAQLYRATGSWDQALAAYNWGIGNVQKKGMAAAPAETRTYVSKILSAIGLA